MPDMQWVPCVIPRSLLCYHECLPSLIWLPPFPHRADNWLNFPVASGVPRHRVKCELFSCFQGSVGTLCLGGHSRDLPTKEVGQWVSSGSYDLRSLEVQAFVSALLHYTSHSTSAYNGRDEVVCALGRSHCPTSTLWWIQENYKGPSALPLQQLWTNRLCSRRRQASKHSGLQRGLRKMKRCAWLSAEIQFVKTSVLHTLVQSWY